VSPGHSSRAKLLLSLLLAVAIFAFLFRRVDVTAVRAEIGEMTWFELVTIALLAGWNLVTYPGGSRGPGAPWRCSSPVSGTPSSSWPCPCSPWP
jgi:hypothetical protein